MKYFLVFSVLLLVFGGFNANSADDHDHGEHEHEEAAEFQLSAAAVKNFGLKYSTIRGAGPWEVPASAVLFSQEEVSLYRYRNGTYSRIHFETVGKGTSSRKVTSKDLQSGDAIVITGVGYLRIAELAASGETPEGHSH